MAAKTPLPWQFRCSEPPPRLWTLPQWNVLMPLVPLPHATLAGLFQQASVINTPRTTASDVSSTVCDTPSARRAQRGRSQMSPWEAALAPVVTPEQLLASLEKLDAAMDQSEESHPASPGL